MRGRYRGAITYIPTYYYYGEDRKVFVNSVDTMIAKEEHERVRTAFVIDIDRKNPRKFKPKSFNSTAQILDKSLKKEEVLNIKS